MNCRSCRLLMMVSTERQTCAISLINFETFLIIMALITETSPQPEVLSESHMKVWFQIRGSNLGLCYKVEVWSMHQGTSCSHRKKERTKS